jgi:hypothetical protein
MNAPLRPLTGCVVNLSISESDNSVARGYPSWQINRVTLQIVSALFGQGSSIAFGHDWRENGVMEAVYGFARQVQSPIPLSAEEIEKEAQPLLRNYLTWPDTPFLSEKDLERLRSTLQVESVALPPELLNFVKDGVLANQHEELYLYLRARALTSLRHRLNEICDARLCLGGGLSGAQGRYPGVIEEALLALRENKPLYLAGLFGGAAEQVTDAFEGKQMPESFCIPTLVTKLYIHPPIEETAADTRADRIFDPEGIWKEFSEAGIEWLSTNNGLTPDENLELLHTRGVDQVVEFVLTGLSRLQWGRKKN